MGSCFRPRRRRPAAGAGGGGVLSADRLQHPPPLGAGGTEAAVAHAPRLHSSPEGDTGQPGEEARGRDRSLDDSLFGHFWIDLFTVQFKSLDNDVMKL